MGNTPMSISTFDHGINPCVKRGVRKVAASCWQSARHAGSLSLGADGQLEYVGPATIANRPGGVGIVFVKDKWNELYVNLLVKNGPAHLSMQVQQGDLLRSVNGAQDILDPLKDIMGPEGTFVRLGFERSPGDLHYVDLERSHQCYPDELMLPPPGYEFPSRQDDASAQYEHEEQAVGDETPIQHLAQSNKDLLLWQAGRDGQ